MSVTLHPRRWLVLIVSLALLIGLSAVRLTFAQTPEPTATPDPALLVLQTEVRVMKTEIAISNRDLESRIQATLQFAQKDIDSIKSTTQSTVDRLNLLLGGGTVGLAGVIAIAVWIYRAKKQIDGEVENQLKAIEKKASERLAQIQAEQENKFKDSEKRTSDQLSHLEQSNLARVQETQKRFEDQILDIEKSNPRYMRVFVPATDFDNEANHLRTLGFSDLKAYETLSEIREKELSGIVIVKSTDIERILSLKQFIAERKADLNRVAFIVYLPSFVKEANETINAISQEFTSISMANTIVRVASDIHTLATGIYAHRKVQAALRS
jgi:hypothetical protein